jgi:DNA polymerase III subunit delta'
MPFSDILAQDLAVHWLQRALRAEQVGHAYLFSGPEGIGKRTTALALAKALNCTDEAARAAADFCGVCRSCRLIALGQHPDVRLLTPETTGSKTVIPIDAIRARVGENPPHPLPLREDARLMPLEGRTKVYIIDPANRPGLQEDAGNALLLTVEEPPPHVVIILISSRPSAVLPTLVSRCLPVRFRLAPQEAVRAALVARTALAPEQATAVAGMAAGRLGWALALAGHPAALEARQMALEHIDRLLPAGRPAALRLAEMLRSLAVATDLGGGEESGDAKSRPSPDRIARRSLPELLDVVASWWRDLLLTKHGRRDLRTNLDFAEALDRGAAHFSEAELRDGLRIITETKRLLERNANLDLALERLWMRILPKS